MCQHSVEYKRQNLTSIPNNVGESMQATLTLGAMMGREDESIERPIAKT